MFKILCKKIHHSFEDVLFFYQPRALGLGSIDIDDLAKDPMEQFARWYKQAEKRSWPKPVFAMTIATIDKNGNPNTRNVALAKHDTNGFEFNTNFNSVKAQELDANPHAALNFYWDAVGRQVRVQGKAVRLNPQESEAYYRERSRFLQTFEWAQKDQSKPMESKKQLAQLYEDYKQEFTDKEIPYPEYFGGYRIIPERVELLQFGSGWLKMDRFVYTRQEDGSWTIQRLFP